MSKEKCILAYSGGLDTSALVPYMKEKYGYDIIAVLVDVGRMKDLEEPPAAGADRGRNRLPGPRRQGGVSPGLRVPGPQGKCALRGQVSFALGLVAAAHREEDG